jgi:2-polyprenyl-6-hydroxyphenyl methylase/3-demethylubiquinone-9 3-methyltransferase
MIPSENSISDEYFQLVVSRERAMDADYAARRALVKLSKLRTPSPGESIVDIGCGTGRVTAAFANLGLQATGIDIVPEFVDVARREHPRATFAVGPAERLPFAEGAFDFAVMLSLLEHVQDWRRSLREAVRVLKPGGVLLLTTTNRICPRQDEIRYLVGFGYLPGVAQRAIYKFAMQRAPQLINHTHLPAYHWFRYGQLAEELRRMGAEPVNWLRNLREADVPERYGPGRRPLIAASRIPLPIFSVAFSATHLVAKKARGSR